MNILLFGATGGTGREVLSQGLEQKHTITAFVRNPAAMTIKQKNLSIIKGDLTDQKSIDDALHGQDIVISALGNKTKNAIWKSNSIISEGLGYILAGMKKQRVKRLLFLTSFGVSDKIFLPEKIFIRTILRNIFADIPKQEQLISSSGLDWTIVHPARLINEQKRGVYHIGENLMITPFSKIARADVADFLLKNLQTTKYVRKIVTIMY